MKFSKFSDFPSIIYVHNKIYCKYSGSNGYNHNVIYTDNDNIVLYCFFSVNTYQHFRDN